MPYAQTYVPSEGTSRSRYGVPNEMPIAGIFSDSTRWRAAIGTAIDPAPDRARTAKAITATSADCAEAMMGGSGGAIRDSVSLPLFSAAFTAAIAAFVSGDRRT